MRLGALKGVLGASQLAHNSPGVAQVCEGERAQLFEPRRFCRVILPQRQRSGDGELGQVDRSVRRSRRVTDALGGEELREATATKATRFADEGQGLLVRIPAEAFEKRRGLRSRSGDGEID